MVPPDVLRSISGDDGGIPSKSPVRKEPDEQTLETLELLPDTEPERHAGSIILTNETIDAMEATQRISADQTKIGAVPDDNFKHLSGTTVPPEESSYCAAHTP